jgi:O-antigen/teichoic acid export membrane protein
MIIVVVSTIIITPLLLTRLGKEGYGVWMLVGQVIAYLAILDLGVGSSIGRFVAKYNARRDYKNISRIISSAIFLFFMSSILIILGTFILWPNFSKFFDLSDKYFNTGRWLILLTGLGVALSFPLKIGQGVLEGIHRFHLIYLLRASGSFIKLLLISIVFGLLGYKSLILLAIITIVITVLPNLLMCTTAHKKFPDVSLGFKYIDFSSLKEISSLSLSALLVTLATLLFNQGQIISVGKIVGPEAVTLYIIPVMLLTYGSMVTAYIIAAFKPMASHMQALDKKQGLKELNIRGVKISFAICLFIAVIAMAFGYPFFRIWLSASKDLSEQDFTVLYNVLAIMVIGFAVGAPQNITAKMLSGTNRQWFAAFVSLAASITGLFIGIFFMTKTSLGLRGMALGWSAVLIIKGVLVFPLSACHYFKINIFSYLKKVYLPLLMAVTVLATAAYITRAIINTVSVASLVLGIAFCTCVYAVAVYFFCLDEKEKLQIQSIIIGLKNGIDNGHEGDLVK